MPDNKRYMTFFDLKYYYFSQVKVEWKKKESEIMYAHELISKVDKNEIKLKYLEKNALISIYKG